MDLEAHPLASADRRRRQADRQKGVERFIQETDSTARTGVQKSFEIGRVAAGSAGRRLLTRSGLWGLRLRVVLREGA